MDTQKFFDERAESYRRLSSWATRGDLLKESMNMIQDIHGPAVVDLGSGTGFLLKHIRGFTHKVAIDISARMLQQIHDKDIIKIIADVRDIPLASSSVTLAICRQVLHYCNPIEIIKEVRRILEPGGYFHVVQITGHDEVPESWYAYWVDLRGVNGRHIIFRHQLLKYMTGEHFTVVGEKNHIIRIRHSWADFFEKNRVPQKNFEEVKRFFKNTGSQIADHINLKISEDDISYTRQFTFLLARSPV